MNNVMAENRIHPSSADHQEPLSAKSSDHLLPESAIPSSSPPSAEKKPLPPPTYVIQLPKEQIFSYPPPENARKFDLLTRRKTGRSRCRTCLYVTIVLLLLLILAASITAGVIYFVFRPKAPSYTVQDLSIRGFNLTSPSPISPVFDVTIRAENPNKKIGIDYKSGSEVEVFHGDVRLANGGLPVFYQPSNNVTVFKTELTGSNVVLATNVKSAILNEQKQAKVPLNFKIKAPVKIKVGSVKTWKITVRVSCEVTVSALDEKANIVSKDCQYNAKLW
ncbi:OLC1v1005000C1 [Oldenlandia corymbosa var. corymbosa]|uniref:OLC1v1005000C1 n=1 Tax=Oldenlandia corymbosa var. corymbosa TaxID=529605 RepID=A0AAV1DED5_OLDCO|nr:OLC1v1005000C1 [Oldenlandia corymbosa var. corymbosa]